jgi:Phosphotransferase enzyme family
MNPPATPSGKDQYRIIFLQPGSQEIWAHWVHGALRLPRIAIPPRTRPAEQLQLAIEDRWGLRSIVLEILRGGCDTGPCAVIEVPRQAPRRGMTATGIDLIACADMTDDARRAVTKILLNRGLIRRPFSRPGWINEAREWVQAAVGREIPLSNQVRQYNAAGNFALLRFGARDGARYWLKATGEPNTHEFGMTKLLGEICAASVPTRLAERVDWNAWLMADAGEPPDCWTYPELELAVSTMADLQQRTIGHAEDLLRAGAFDQRLCVLRSHLGELFEYLDQAMTRQSSTKVPRIESRRLWEMAIQVRDACLLMESLEIPDTVIHNDMNSSNVLFRGQACVITDWCEAGLGNPFFTFQHLCRLKPKRREDWAFGLQDAYRRCWLERLGSFRIELAFVLAPPLAILSYLYGRGRWLCSRERNDPRVESHARALARHLERAAQDRRLLEALCR